MYSIINVHKGNKILKTIEVSFPILVIPKRKNTINPKVSACKIPKMKKMFLFGILLN
jgi:hypothetical protein